MIVCKLKDYIDGNHVQHFIFRLDHLHFFLYFASTLMGQLFRRKRYLPTHTFDWHMHRMSSLTHVQTNLFMRTRTRLK